MSVAEACALILLAVGVLLAFVDRRAALVCAVFALGCAAAAMFLAEPAL